jgi:hypothetical protein
LHKVWFVGYRFGTVLASTWYRPTPPSDMPIDLTCLRRSPRRIVLLVLVVCAPISLLAGILTFDVYGLGAHTALFAYVVVLLGYLAWSEFRLNQREVRIDASNRVISIHEMTFLRQRRVSTFVADSFYAVVSYIGPGKSPCVCVELMTQDSRHGLRISEFRVTAWMDEPPEAQQLRLQLSTVLGLQDGGFLGARFPLRRFKEQL